MSSTYNKEYYEKNREKLLKRAKEYHQHKDPEEKRKYRREYYAKHKQEMKEYNGNLYRAMQDVDKWTRGTIYGHRYAGYTVDLTRDELRVIVSRISHCQICGKELKFNTGRAYNNITLDRMNNEPFISRDNILIICRECNNTKGSRTLKEFIDYCKMVVSKEGDWEK